MKPPPQDTLVPKVVLLVLCMLVPFAWTGKQQEHYCALFFLHPNMMSIMSTNPSALAAHCLPWRADLWEQAAKQAREAGDFGAAAAYLERLGEEAARFGVDPEEAVSQESLELLADAYLQQGDTADALDTKLKIASQWGLDEALTEEISSLYLEMGDFTSATGVWKELKAIEPDNLNASYQLGRLLAIQDPEAALPYLEEAAHADLGLSYAAEELYHAIAHSGASYERAYQLVAAGRSLAAGGEWRLAAEAFHQATLLHPDYSEAWAFLGEARQQEPAAGSAEDRGEDLPPGFRELQKAVELDPQSLSAHTLLALFHRRQGDLEAALQEIDLSLDLSPHNPVLISQRASLLAASGKLEGACAEYQRAASLAPHDPAYLRQTIMFSLAYSYQVEQTALPLARQLLENDPDSPADLDLLAQVLIKMGNLDEAERLLAKALEIEPKNASAHLNMGIIALLRGDPEASRRFLEAAIQLDPESAAAEQARRLLEGGSP